MSQPLSKDDPAYWMLERGANDPSWRTTPEVHKDGCYICEDPEFAQMGLPLCKACPRCSMKEDGQLAGHVPADDEECTECGYNLHEHYDKMADLQNPVPPPTHQPGPEDNLDEFTDWMKEWNP